jgi:hypothetical protein
MCKIAKDVLGKKITNTTIKQSSTHMVGSTVLKQLLKRKYKKQHISIQNDSEPLRTLVLGGFCIFSV